MQRTRENERRDWIIILLIIFLGFLCVIVAGQWAARFSPRWELDTNMGSKLNPNSDFLTSIPQGEIEPVDPAILTPPSWLEFFLTPGASFRTFTPIPTDTVTATSTIQPTQTNTAIATSTATSTSVVYITSTSYPTATRTAAPGSTFTPTATATTVPSTTATNTPTSTPSNTPTSTPTNTPTNTPTSTPTNTPTSTPTDTPTNTPTSTPIPIDVSISKDDGVTTYTPNGVLTYTIVVTNNSAVTLNAATVTDMLPAQISSATWMCTVPSPAGPITKCDPSGTGNLNSTVTLAANEYVTYTVTANISAFAVGTLDNTATVTIPSGYLESDLTNNSATDSDTPTGAAASPNIGPPDGSYINPGAGGSATLVFSPAIVANASDVGAPDLVYYEIISTAPDIALDWVRIEISTDGSSWITVFDWGNGSPDKNTNVDLALVGDLCQTGGVPAETDNCSIPITRLYNNSTGISIDIDAIPGIMSGASYPWMKITGTGSQGPDIDAIQILP